jgi:hypothetical protein
MQYTLIRQSRKNGKMISSIENLEIIRTTGERYGGSGCYFASGFSMDRRKFCLSMVSHNRSSLRSNSSVETMQYSIMHEVKKFRLIQDENGAIDLKKIVRDFIISQYLDTEKITTEWVREDLNNSESISPVEGARSRYSSFSEICQLWRFRWHGDIKNEQIEEVAEEVLIDLFCETEDSDRVLIEENGVFSWQIR